MLLHDSKSVKQHPSLEQTLEHFTRDELQAFVIQLAGHIPHLAEARDKEAASRQPALSQPQSTSTVSDKPPLTKVDTKAVRRQRASEYSFQAEMTLDNYQRVADLAGE